MYFNNSSELVSSGQELRCINSTNETVTLVENGHNRDTAIVSFNTNELIFLIAVKGVLNTLVDLLSTILSASTIAVFLRYRNLQIPSHVLLILFSIGNAFLALPGGILTVFNLFYMDRYSTQWTITCTFQGYIQTLQQMLNVLSLAAISVERAYFIYCPFHAREHTTFKGMVKMAAILMMLCLLVTTSWISLGFVFGNFDTRLYCLISRVTGSHILWYSIFPGFLLASLITLINTLLIFIKLMQLRQKIRSISITRFSQTSSDYKITKMLLTGKTLQLSFVLVVIVQLYSATWV